MACWKGGGLVEGRNEVVVLHDGELGLKSGVDTLGIDLLHVHIDSSSSIQVSFKG